MSSDQVFSEYAPDRVVLTFAGTMLQGFADGTFVNVKPMAAGFTSKAGADGLVSHSRTNDPRIGIEITLMAGSSGNDKLSAVHEADLTSTNGAGVSAFSLTDLNGTSLVECTYCRVMQAPDQEYGKEDGDRVWVLEGVKARRVTGGR